MTTLETCLAATSAATRAILDRCLSGGELSWREAVELFSAKGPDLAALCLAADTLRREQAGDVVTYVVNRNINFTNVCVKACGFCAFSRTLRSEEGYFLDPEEIGRRALEARQMGATEVCIQAGLAPMEDGKIYAEVCRAVKRAVPDIHIHAYSPEEVKYGAGLSKVSVREFVQELKEAGLDTLPGTSAEILDETLRTKISPGRITTAEWIEVVTTAHDLGLPTTSTMMFGHVETFEHRARHMDLLRSIQRETGGFSEFVPLSFVHEEAPMFVRKKPGVQPGPTGNDVLRLYAIARLMLGPSMRNIQASWVKEGLRQSQILLGAGVNDLGGTLINESISTSAGASHGQLARPSTLRHLIRDAGRIPAQRSTAYEILRTFGPNADLDELDPLDTVEDPDAVFGSYVQLTKDPRFRFRRPAQTSR